MIRRQRSDSRPEITEPTRVSAPIIAAAIFVLATGVLSTGLVSAESAGIRIVREGEGRCGVVDPSARPPTTSVQVDLDGDGRAEHYIATWGGVEKHRLQEGTHPPTLVRESIVYTSSVNQQYSCVDLSVRDVDGDGALDLVFGGHRELVVLLNRGGRLVPSRREPQELPAESRLRLRISGNRLEVVAQ
jgi:hypothetical protein